MLTNTNTEEWLNFIVGLVDSLAWPIAILVMALIFKQQIISLVKAIRRVRVGQFEAEIEKVKEEAAATITQLQELALALSIPAAESFPGIIESYDGNYSSVYNSSVSDRFQQAKKVIDELVKLGVDRNRAESLILTPINNHVRNAHINWIRGLLNKQLNPESATIITKKEFEFPALDKLKENEISVTEAKKELVESLTEIPQEFNERFEDLKYFDETGDLRRPSVPPWCD